VRWFAVAVFRCTLTLCAFAYFSEFGREKVRRGSARGVLIVGELFVGFGFDSRRAFEFEGERGVGR